MGPGGAGRPEKSRGENARQEGGGSGSNCRKSFPTSGHLQIVTKARGKGLKIKNVTLKSARHGKKWFSGEGPHIRANLKRSEQKKKRKKKGWGGQIETH